MGNTKSKSMENKRLEDLIAELKDIRTRESEILIEIEEIIRTSPDAAASNQAARRASAPVGAQAQVHTRQKATSAKHPKVRSVVKEPQILETINGIAKGDRVFLKTRVNKPSGWPDSSKWEPERSRYGTVIQVAVDQIHIRTDTGITTWRAPHNAQRIVD
jgi:hypothetical protein